MSDNSRKSGNQSESPGDEVLDLLPRWVISGHHLPPLPGGLTPGVEHQARKSTSSFSAVLESHDKVTAA